MSGPDLQVMTAPDRPFGGSLDTSIRLTVTVPTAGVRSRRQAHCDGGEGGPQIRVSDQGRSQVPRKRGPCD